MFVWLSEKVPTEEEFTDWVLIIDDKCSATFISAGSSATVTVTPGTGTLQLAALNSSLLFPCFCVFVGTLDAEVLLNLIFTFRCGEITGGIEMMKEELC